MHKIRKWDFVTYTHNKQRALEAKLVRGYTDVKSLGKDGQCYTITASVAEV